MATWPAIADPTRGGVEETSYRPQVRTEAEANYVHTRPRVTRTRKKWSLTWDLISEADLQLLSNFFDANQGNSFTWINPITKITYTNKIIFSEDSLISHRLFYGYHSTFVKIEEL